MAPKKKSGTTGRQKRATNSTPPPEETTDRLQYVSLGDETRRRYLNYALSVIQSRALPDVRDGMKPVQRRIMYVMYNDLHLTNNAKPKKCSKIVGDTIGNYHPHGDSAVYDALVRLAQDFSLREPLIDGQGNFGSIMGLPAAAARYTEARLTPIAAEMMEELKYDTVPERENYDGTRNEPIVLPTRFPGLLVNGVQGIAVGMATSIPPHNLGEVLKAAKYLVDHPEATVPQLMKYIKGPDFPLGGRMVTDRIDLRNTYKTGRGAIKVRGEWKKDTEVRKTTKSSKEGVRIVINSIPFGVDSGSIVAAIGDIVASRKLPQLLDVSDETNEKYGLRIILEIKSENDIDAVFAFLYKHTSLEQNFSYNCTALIPDGTGNLVPRQLSLVELLQHFLDFRYETVVKRFEYLLQQLLNRIHILKGFVIVFNGLDKALKIIRKSTGKKDAAEKLMKAFPLDEIQTYAILELQLYRISSLEIDSIREELREKEKEAKRIQGILKSKVKLWKIIKGEFDELAEKFGTRRRTGVGSSDEIEEFDPQAYIVRENSNVVLTSDGWIKRVGKIQSVKKLRTREGDEVIEVLPGSTLDHAIMFADDGTAFTLPIDQVPASTGYGEPLAKFAKLKDGAKLLTGISTDPRFTVDDYKVRGEATPGPYLLVATAKGLIMRISLSAYRLASTKSGRKYCRLSSGDKVVSVRLATKEAKTLFLATKKARIIHFEVKEAPVLANAGKGVKGIKLETGDEVMDAQLLSRPSDCLRVINSNGKQLTFGQAKYGVTGRGGKGVKTSQRTDFETIIRPEIELVDWAEIE